MSLLYGPKQQGKFRLSLISSLFLMVLAAVAATLEAFGTDLPYLTYGRYGLMVYFVGQAVLGTAGYHLRGYTNGASDNATGVAAALATADRLRQMDMTDVAVTVVLTSAEEVGMIGAYHYVEAHRKQWNPARTTVVNFDTLGAGRLTVIEKTGTLEPIWYNNAPTQLARQLLQTDAFRERARMGRWHTADFDSVWFVRNHIPVLALCALDAGGRMPRIHQADDTFAELDPTPLYVAVDLAEAVVLKRVAAGAEKPGERP